jgi:hypothetical protein
MLIELLLMELLEVELEWKLEWELEFELLVLVFVLVLEFSGVLSISKLDFGGDSDPEEEDIIIHYLMIDCSHRNKTGSASNANGTA